MTNATKGFGSMDKDKQRKIASLGGKRAHEMGKAHKWNREEAIAAGKIGGRATRKS